jgi:sugar phosphate isomerase/epimerase
MIKLSSIVTLEGGFYFPDLVAGKTFEARVRQLKALGFDSIEIWGEGLPAQLTRVRKILKQTGMEVSAVCSGFRGSILSGEQELREVALSDLKTLLKAAGELGAAGVVMMPIFKFQKGVSGLLPFKSAEEVRHDLFIYMLGELAKVAGEAGTRILLEPGNRYETDLLNRVEQAAAVVDEVGSKAVGVIADTFHMNIEEIDLAAVFKRYSSYIKHIHLTDSNRYIPGQGHTDFAPVFKVLKAAGYAGAVSFESFVMGDKTEAMRKSVALIDKLRGRQ